MKEFSTEELEKELKRREDIIKSCPDRVNNPDLSELFKFCEEYFVELKLNQEDVGDKLHFFESVLETLYGKKIWDYIIKVEELNG